MNSKLISIIILTYLSLNAEMKPVRSLAKNSDPVLVSNEVSRSDKIILSYIIPEPNIVTTLYQELDGKKAVRTNISNCPYLYESGKPEIPRIPVRLILPYGKTIDYIEVIPGNKNEKKLSAPLAWGELEQPINVRKRIVSAPDYTIYRSDNRFPEKLYGNFEIQKAFGVSIGKVDIYPLTYFSKSQIVSYYKNLSLIVHLKSVSLSNEMRIDIERFKKRGKLTEENEDALNTYPSQRARRETIDYVLITSESIANDNTFSPNVQDLVNLREEQGFSCKVMTTEEIEANYNGTAMNEKIRNFIKYAYNDWSTEFVTLGGDINIVAHYPEKITYGFNPKIVDTDIPFQCLDGDSWSGDYEAEVYVGRIAAENAEEFSNQLYKIIQYETEPVQSSFLRTSLGLGCNLDWNNSGMRSIEYLLFEVFPSTWQHDSLYDATDPSGEWEQGKLIDKLASNKYGNVDHDGHGSVGGTMRFSVGETDRFTNTKYPFLYTLSCQTGDFSEDCIAEHFITEHRTGGFFGGILNSEVGLYSQANSTEGSSPTIQRSFWRAFWEQDIKYLSQCNAYSHQMNTDKKFTCYTTNYFGDAATRFRGKDDSSVANISKKVVTNKGAQKDISGISLFSKHLRFNLSHKSKLAIKIYSLNGRCVYSVPVKEYRGGDNFISLGKNILPKGMFIVEIKNNTVKVSQKISL